MDYRVKIDLMLHMDAYGLWICGYRADDRRTFVAKPLGELVFEPHAEGRALPPPTLVVGGRDKRQLLTSIAEGLAAGHIEAPAESFVKGKLEATERHLRDLRYVLKLDRREGGAR